MVERESCDIVYYIFDKGEGRYLSERAGIKSCYKDILQVEEELDAMIREYGDSVLDKLEVQEVEIKKSRVIGMREISKQCKMIEMVRVIQDRVEDGERVLERDKKTLDKLKKKMMSKEVLESSVSEEDMSDEILEEVKVSSEKSEIVKKVLEYGKRMEYFPGDVIVYRRGGMGIFRIERKVPHRGGVFYDSVEVGWKGLHRKDMRIASREEVEKLGDMGYCII